MKKSLAWPLAGSVAAIGITTAMDASGLSAFSALPLALLLFVFWRAQHLSRTELGVVWGRGGAYALAAAFPLIVMGAGVTIAFSQRAMDLSHADWRKAALNVALISLSTMLVALITEEGFFRGWLWASLARAGRGKVFILIATSVVFMLWHISAVTLETGFNPPPEQVPIFLSNALVLGIVWGMLRLASGSVVVSSLSHGVWNGLAYALFGFGKHVGALGIRETGIYGPEVGVLGLALNLALALALVPWCVRAVRSAGAPRPA